MVLLPCPEGDQVLAGKAIFQVPLPLYALTHHRPIATDATVSRPATLGKFVRTKHLERQTVGSGAGGGGAARPDHSPGGLDFAGCTAQIYGAKSISFCILLQAPALKSIVKVPLTRLSGGNQTE